MVPYSRRHTAYGFGVYNRNTSLLTILFKAHMYHFWFHLAHSMEADTHAERAVAAGAAEAYMKARTPSANEGS